MFLSVYRHSNSYYIIFLVINILERVYIILWNVPACLPVVRLSLVSFISNHTVGAYGPVNGDIKYRMIYISYHLRDEIEKDLGSVTFSQMILAVQSIYNVLYILIQSY